MINTVVRRLGRLCERFGLGRLPGADNRVVGAGYALVATALLVGVLLVVTSYLLAVFGVADGLSVPELRFVVAALPFVTVSAFCSGVVVWRYLPDGSPRYGAIGGFAAACLTYVLSTVFLLPVVVLLGHEGSSLSLSTAAVYTLLIAVIGTILTGWLALPAGVAAGYLYESARVRHRNP